MAVLVPKREVVIGTVYRAFGHHAIPAFSSAQGAKRHSSEDGTGHIFEHPEPDEIWADRYEHDLANIELLSTISYPIRS